MTDVESLQGRSRLQTMGQTGYSLSSHDTGQRPAEKTVVRHLTCAPAGAVDSGLGLWEGIIALQNAA